MMKSYLLQTLHYISHPPSNLFKYPACYSFWLTSSLGALLLYLLTSSYYLFQDCIESFYKLYANHKHNCYPYFVSLYQTEMATLNSLKEALRQKVTSSPRQLSDTQYGDTLDALVQNLGWETYQEFNFPKLSELLTPLFNSRPHVSVLEIGPGPQSVFAYLPERLRWKIRKYSAFEPNEMFATELEEWLCSALQTESPPFNLQDPPDIHRLPFDVDRNAVRDTEERFDVVLFCQDMCNMKPKQKLIERALEMLIEGPEGGMVVVFHREPTLHLDGLVCHKTSSFPTGVVCVENNDEILDRFSAVVAGFSMQDMEMHVGKKIQSEWRTLCRTLGRCEKTHPGRLFFSSPYIMATFTKHATKLAELVAQVPLLKGERKVFKNREVVLHHPASIVRPTKVEHIQQCVRWAVKHKVALTVIGGSHSGHCIVPNVVSIDMSAFDQIHIVRAIENDDSLIVVEAGCKTGDIILKAMEAGLTVPLGARPSVGAGMWLQGGIGHLARLYGLACDAIIGAVVVSVNSSRVLCVGHVPKQHQPAGCIFPENESDLLWALKGAGTNFGIVVSVTFKAYTALTYSVRNWVVPLTNNVDAQLKLKEFDELIATELPQNCSADAYLYWNIDQMHLAVTMIQSSTTTLTLEAPTATDTRIHSILGSDHDFKIVDGVGLFETEMYISGMHGGHGGGKTSSFKRCLFLKHIGTANITKILVAAISTRPSPLSYLHLLHGGGGAVGEVAAEDTAFGCRDWDLACVVTGVWPRDQDGTEVAHAAVRWVYDVTRDLLPLSSGIYGADLGPDPRDAALASQAFGHNRPRLASLKLTMDPHHVLAYTCPLPKAPKLIILVTGESGAGKDYSAIVWCSVFTTYTEKYLTARVTSISDKTKQEYCAASGADLNTLLQNRSYKEQHRPALTAFYQEQVRQRPSFPKEHFLKVVYDAGNVDVLLITGMRDEAPLVALSHLVPHSRLLDVRVKARGEEQNTNGGADLSSLGYRPSLTFRNDTLGNEAAKRFAETELLRFFHPDLQQLANMVPPVPDFPRPGIEFRHVLNIAQQPGGIDLCTSLLQTHFNEDDWDKVDVVTCCEAGGFIFASALALRLKKPLALIREAGKLPPPTVSVVKTPSHISHPTLNDSKKNGPKKSEIEIGRDTIPRGASVVVVDDVLSTGETLCAVLQLLHKIGISTDAIHVLTVAEFPIHRGRELLRQRGFGEVGIASLLVFGGA